MVRSAAFATLLAVGGSAARIAKHRNSSVGISIVNGQPADECEWKHQVGLLSRAGGTPWCGGMLISAEWVLTAAHCLVSSSGVYVVAGEWSTTQTSGNEQYRYSSNIVIHPSYNSQTFTHDYALAQVDTAFTLNSCVAPVALPTADAAAGSSCWITGWGTLRSGGSQPTTLQEAEVNIISNAACTSTYAYSSGDIDDSMICAQGRSASGGITDACQGDSGGPLVCEQNGAFAIIGATSWGYGCAGATYPGVWARVYKELAWIDDVMSGTYVPVPTPAPCPSYCSSGYYCWYSACTACDVCR